MELTIDELARRTGMTTRNIRAHQTRGLLPRPALRGRTAYYGHEHVERLGAVQSLQSHGVSLQEIRELFERAPGARTDELVAVARAAAKPFGDEESLVVDVRAMREHWGEQVTPELLDRIARLPFVRRDDDRFEFLSARLYQAALELGRLGIPLDAGVDLVEELWRHADALAEMFIAMFIDRIWHQSDPAAGPVELQGAVDRLRPLSGVAVMATFGLAMNQAVSAALERMVREGG